MQHVVIKRPGGYERLEVEDAPDPIAGPGEVLIDVQAIGVNFADCIIRMGLYASARQYVGYPITPGFEVAGLVHEAGEGVDNVSVGQRVMGVTRFDGYASRLVLPARQVFPLPDDLELAEAAGFPTVFLTAWYALFELAHPRPGQTLLVHSAAGGVGGALVQLGRRAGCTVVGVVGSAHKIETARSMGADHVINRSAGDVWQQAENLAPNGYDVILDANGVATLRASYEHLGPTGKLVVYGFHSMFKPGRGRPSWPQLLVDYLRTPRFNPLKMTGQNRSVLAFNLSYLFDQGDLLQEGMDQLLGWLREGAIRPHTVTTYAMRDVASAHRALESAQTTGKLVLLPD
jgi:NADPH:quinone reductase-like Zn-dependent oxidoreductase